MSKTTANLDQLTVDTDARSLAGLVAGTSASRDWEIVHWIGRMGAATLDQVRARFALGRTAAYRRVAVAVDAGLVERVSLLRAQPALLRATRRGLRYVGLPLGVAQAPPELVGHWIACGWVAVALEREFGPGSVRSEREVRQLERCQGRAVASARLGEKPDGSERLHLPDLAVVREERTVAIEVELTPKAPKRLEAIVRAWRRARWVDSTRYYVRAGGVRRGLERAIERAHAADRIDVRPIESLLDERVPGGDDR